MTETDPTQPRADEADADEQSLADEDFESLKAMRRANELRACRLAGGGDSVGEGAEEAQ